MGRRSGRAALAILVLLGVALPSLAGPIPSKASLDAQRADRASIETVLAREEVARALAAHGLSPQDVEQRLAQLSPEEMSALAANLDQVQAAGAVPNYIWILLAILMAVTILATVF
jgi:hypothetical protein